MQPASALLDGVGGTLVFRAEGVDENGFVLAGQPIVWRSLNPAVASVAGDSTTGRVVAVTSGQAIIEARSSDPHGAAIVGYALVTVSVPNAPSLGTLNSSGSGTGEPLSDLWGSSPADIYAVGSLGTIQHYNGTTWAPAAQSGLPTANLRGVWGASAADVYVVGEAGTVLHADSTGVFSAVNAHTTEALLDVWGASPRAVFVVGAHGVIRLFNGLRWDSLASGTTANLRAVWGTSAQEVWAAGDGGTILHYDGTQWRAEASGSAEILTALWGTSPGHVLAVGGGGTILRRAAEGWTPQQGGTSEPLNAVWGTSASNVYAVGAAGMLLRYNGTDWASLASGGNQDLLAIWGSSTGEVHVTGANGLMLASERGGGPRLVFARVPASSVTAGDAFQVDVQVVDGTGALVTSATDVISVALAGGGSIPPLGATTTAVQNGVATFTLRIIRAAAGYSLSASAAARQTARSPSFTVDPAAAARTEFVVHPSTTQLGQLIAPAPQVAVTDTFGNVVRNFQRDVEVGLLGTNSNASALQGLKARTAVNGVATFSGLSVIAGGNDFTLVSFASGLSRRDTSDIFQILAGGFPATIAFVPDGITVTLLDTLQLVVEARDGNGVQLPDIPSIGFTNAFVVASIAIGSSNSRALVAVRTGQTVASATVQGVTGYGMVTVVARSPVPLTHWDSLRIGTATLHAVISPGKVMAVGDDGSVVTVDNNGQGSRSTIGSEVLRAVWSAGGQEPVYAVSESGGVFRVDGAAGEVARLPGVPFTGIWGAAPGDMVVVSSSCQLAVSCRYRFDGQHLTPAAPEGPNSSSPAHGIWGSSSSNQFIARVGGAATFGPVSRTCGASDLNGVWGTTPNDVFMVGNSGTIVHWNGANCQLMSSGVTVTLYGVTGFSANDVYAVGEGGTILHYDGFTWSPVASPTSTTLRAVAGFHQDDVIFSGGNIINAFERIWAVGDSGVVVIGRP